MGSNMPGQKKATTDAQAKEAAVNFTLIDVAQRLAEVRRMVNDLLFPVAGPGPAPDPRLATLAEVVNNAANEARLIVRVRTGQNEGTPLGSPR